MAQTIIRDPRDTLLELKNPDAGLFRVNHIFEAEYHQAEYVDVCEQTAQIPGAFLVGADVNLFQDPRRGIQPQYADDEAEPDSLEFEGMLLKDGSRLDSAGGTRNVCALKSASVRFGYLDLESARSVTRDFHQKVEKRAGVRRNDVLVNSTGDGTIGRVAVFNYDFPAIVDGHITILRYKDPVIAWYVAAYLLSDDGQRQLYRYINGSSGQVEIYPQDIERVWVKPATPNAMKEIGLRFREACEKHDTFARDLKTALNLI
jgi:type I restriction enzyme M protein